ncbi:MAG: Rossmann-like and DUF2520 domain-containing protein [Gemmatimonadaceae bacterium]
MGRGLAAAFRSAGLSVLGVHARTAREGATSSGLLCEAAQAVLAGVLSDANVIIIAVSDGSINDVCRDLVQTVRANSRAMAKGTVVLNTSGMISPEAYSELRTLGFPCGTFHPLAPFATAERGAAAVRNGWVGIEGDATACSTARRLAAAVGARTINIPTDAKATYHAAAVMASNFPVVLVALATRMLVNVGIDERAAGQVVQQLMRAAVANLDSGPPAAVLTGPAARNDSAIIAAHRDAMAGDPETAAVYDALTRAARTLAADHATLVDDARVGGRREAEG